MHSTIKILTPKKFGHLQLQRKTLWEGTDGKGVRPFLLCVPQRKVEGLFLGGQASCPPRGFAKGTFESRATDLLFHKGPYWFHLLCAKDPSLNALKRLRTSQFLRQIM